MQGVHTLPIKTVLYTELVVRESSGVRCAVATA
jgi:hypothetical protein